VSSVNHGFDASTYLQGLPAHRVQQIHLAGHSDQGDHLIDTHDHPVSESVWALYAQARALFGPVATMIERDADIPPLPELLTELGRARHIAWQVDSTSAVAASSDVAPTAPWRATHLTSPAEPDLPTLQRQFAAAILSDEDPTSGGPAEAARQQFEGAHAPQRLAIYHQAYRARLAEVLADSFARTCAYMGSEGFDEQARIYAVQHPPLERSLSRYGAGFPAFLADTFPANPELHELAQLDWDLRSRFDGPDWPALDAEGALQDAASSWLQRPAPLHPSLTMRPVQTNVVQIWKALEADEDVPEAVLQPEPLTLMSWRKGLQPQFQTLDTEQARFVAELANGASIEQTCASLAGSPALQDPQQLGRWLRHWLDEGLLRA
ncbi:DUF692 family multinuclear iron-containing protein, partial [Ideonella sp.]|uniref:multinuclear nonheme iron-dependent oxidase n=1 Tax=Ideonella sp. TaxID=1929293 RepID=UPI003BB80B89